LGREEGSVPALESDRPHAERHADGSRRQEGIVDDRRRGSRSRRLTLAAAAAFVLLASGTSAQTFETVGVRAQGMAGAFVAVADDATATWWNPAGLAAGPFANLVLDYNETDGAPTNPISR